MNSKFLYCLRFLCLLLTSCSYTLSLKVNESNFELSSSPECEPDFEVLAPQCQMTLGQLSNNFVALQCIYDNPNAHKILSDKCQTLLWKFKLSLTNDKSFYDKLKLSCSEALTSLEECEAVKENERKTKSGTFLSCVLSKKNEIQHHPKCTNFLTRIEILIFSDYHLMSDFVTKCSSTIEKYDCGRIGSPYESQFNVISCLGEHIESLDEDCKHEILRISELQADDYHLDRSLYFACKEDREIFCSSVPSGDGKVYECLLRHKKDSKMSPNCKKQIIRRQRLTAHDYKISRGLSKNCREEIRIGNCRHGTSENKPIRIAQILLCLEDMLHENESSIKSLCLGEMQNHRRSLLEDYQMSPELVNQCSSDISTYCEGLKPGGYTIHCLMKAASEGHLTNLKCKDELRVLLQEVDVASDWTLDPILKKTCSDVVSSHCSNLESEETMSCLLKLTASNSRLMSQECKESLLEIEYFLSRSFSLNPSLFHKCESDAKRLCNVGSINKKYESKDGKGSDYIFSCLARHLYRYDGEDDYDSSSELSDDCGEQVEKVLEQRAISVHLHPEIEESCRSSLMTHCTRKSQPGEELGCLQDHYESLSKTCKDSVMTYTRMEAKTLVLNPLLSSACHSSIDSSCASEAFQKDEGAVLKCLIRIQEEREESLGDKCIAAINHWQILSLKDWKFTYAFNEACKRDVKAHCNLGKSRTKYDVVNCLSTRLSKDIIEDKAPSLSTNCRNELKFELLQKHSNVKLNIEISNSCSREIGKFCGKENDPNVLECLKRTAHKFLSRPCSQALFKEEQEAILINSVDHALMTSCKHEIKVHCSTEEEPNGILYCLQDVQSSPSFNPHCRSIVNERTAQQMKDYRLNPRLISACKADLPQFCSDILRNDDDLAKDSEKQFLEGRVIECLAKEFRNEKLSFRCQQEMGNLLRLSALHFNANPFLNDKCPKSLLFCQNETHYDAKTPGEDEGKVEECMIGLFRSKKLGEFGDGHDCRVTLAQILSNANVDIHVDPLLARSCSLDLNKFCRDVPRGHGLQLQCLVAISKSAQYSLENSCQSLLLQRLEMFNMALQVVPLAGLTDLLHTLNESPQKHYFLLSFSVFIFLCFLCGLLTGRCSKRGRLNHKRK